MKYNRSELTGVDYKRCEAVYEQLRDIFASNDLNFFEIQTILTWIKSDTSIALANLTVDYRMEENLGVDERRDVV